MKAKTCFWTSIIVFVLATALCVAGNLTQGYAQALLVLAGTFLLVPGWVLNIVGWFKLFRR